MKVINKNKFKGSLYQRTEREIIVGTFSIKNSLKILLFTVFFLQFFFRTRL